MKKSLEKIGNRSTDLVSMFLGASLTLSFIVIFMVVSGWQKSSIEKKERLNTIETRINLLETKVGHIQNDKRNLERTVRNLINQKLQEAKENQTDEIGKQILDLFQQLMEKEINNG